jgi:LPS-assembly lipoprotein
MRLQCAEAMLVLGLCAALLATAGCGFRMRGAVEVAPGLGPTYVQSVVPHSEFVADLRRSLRAARVPLAEESAQAEAVLRILQEERGRRVLSVGAEGKAREYELSYTVSFEVRDPAARELLPLQRMVQTRAYAFDEQEVLAAEHEEATLYRDMQRQAARQILQRLAAATARSEGQ